MVPQLRPFCHQEDSAGASQDGALATRTKQSALDNDGWLALARQTKQDREQSPEATLESVHLLIS